MWFVWLLPPKGGERRGVKRRREEDGEGEGRGEGCRTSPGQAGSLGVPAPHTGLRCVTCQPLRAVAGH